MVFQSMSAVKVFISPFKGGTTSIGMAVEILGLKHLGHHSKLFDDVEYSLIDLFNYALDAFGSVENIPDEIKEEVRTALAFIINKTDDWTVFHDWPMGHDCIHPFIKVEKGWWPLCEFLGIDVPKVEFPWINKFGS